MDTRASFVSPMSISVNNPNLDFNQIGPVYSPAVLVGNWYEDRLTAATDRHAITPGIYGKSGCTLSETVNQVDFKSNQTQEEAQLSKVRYFNWKQDAFGISLQNNRTQIKLHDGKDFDTNYTTTNDIFFRIQRSDAIRYPKMCLHLMPRRQDTLSSYGNQTTTGKTQYIKRQLLTDSKIPIDQSQYRLSFVEKEIDRNRTIRQRGKTQAPPSKSFP